MKKVFGRILIVLPAIALQVMWYMVLLGFLNDLLNEHLGDFLNAVFSILAVVFVTGIVAKRDESSYKLLWVMIIVAMPIFGAMLYFMIGNKNTGKRLKRKLNQSSLSLTKIFPIDNEANITDIKTQDLRIGQTLEHLTKITGFSVFENDTSRYYAFGEEMFLDMCEDLKKAKKHIYVEYFIIQPGKFWNTLTDIMAQKVTEGVEVKVMYDDLGSIGTYSLANIAELSQKGIKCLPFNPFLFLKSQLNNRDHRKIMVIDGEIAYSGGVNLADEYINEIQKFGRWKDIGFRITGEAVSSYTYMFAEFWNAFSNEKIETERNLEYKTKEISRKENVAQSMCKEAKIVSVNTSGKTTISHMSDNVETILVSGWNEVANREKTLSKSQNNGYLLPYYDSPMYEEHISNVLFTEMLSVATDYVWFYTPYLILGDALYDAFIRAARRGVDVRIIMPGIPDKKIVYRISRSYYKDLLKAGVKIFEYTPGFLHAKAFIADDKIAGIGTVNLDYRSLFLHFECNCIFYKTDIIRELKKDYLNTEAESVERTLEDINNGILNNIVNNMLRVIAPLL